MKINKEAFLSSTLLALALAGCGSANTGSDGTGIRPLPTVQMAASGPLTALGPLGVAGASLDDAGTTVLLNANAARPATELRLGMLTNAEGLVAPSVDAGFATTAVAQSLVIGPVTSVDSARQAFQVMGQPARAHQNTLLEGIAGVGEIVVGDWAEVHGLRLPGNEGMLATRIIVRRPVVDRTVEVLGGVTDFGIPSIAARGLQIDPSNASFVLATPAGIQALPAGTSALVPNQVVRVRGTYDANTNVVAASLIVTGLSPARPEGALVYIEGVVLSQTSTLFQVGDLAVDTTAIATPLVVGSRVKVRGRMQSGSLRADQVTVIASDARIEYTVEGPISAFGSLSDFTVRGERIDASQAAVIDGSASQIGQGRRVRVKGVAGPGRINAREVTVLN